MCGTWNKKRVTGAPDTQCLALDTNGFMPRKPVQQARLDLQCPKA
jgi:hypothetical protein